MTLSQRDFVLFVAVVSVLFSCSLLASALALGTLPLAAALFAP